MEFEGSLVNWLKIKMKSIGSANAELGIYTKFHVNPLIITVHELLCIKREALSASKLMNYTQGWP
jgi:hypothetical protein